MVALLVGRLIHDDFHGGPVVRQGRGGKIVFCVRLEQMSMLVRMRTVNVE
jgi:hypothetical protein